MVLGVVQDNLSITHKVITSACKQFYLLMQLVQNVLLLSFQLILKIDLFCVHLVPLKIELCQLYSMHFVGRVQDDMQAHKYQVYHWLRCN